MNFRTFSLSASRYGFLLCTTFALMPFAAQAQATPVFNPAGSWQVGATDLASVRGLKGLKLPCVVSNEYDNGFVVRFSGGGQQMLAMAIDFRQDVFQQGRKYTAMLSVGDGYVKQVEATAFTSNTLLFNLRSLKEVYAMLQKASAMELDVEGNVFKFSLQQLGQTFGKLETCYTTGRGAKIAPMQNANLERSIDAVNPPAVPVAGVEAHVLPRSFDDIIKAPAEGAPLNIAQRQAQNDGVLPQQNTVSRAQNVAPGARVATPSLAPRRSPAAPIDVQQAAWNARSGEDLQAVLGRWATQAGYDLDWQAAPSGKVRHDMNINGSFEDAVAQLTAANGVGGHIETGAGQMELPSAISAAPAAATSSQWSGPSGANLQTVLDDWGRKAGVNVVWESYASIPLKSPVQQSGAFEEAVQALLDQYQNDPQRPVGQLNTDPETGKRTLMMSVDRSS